MSSSIPMLNNTNFMSSGASSSGSILGKDDFLKMLIMQLRFQDPLNPMNGTEFAAQLAQFSSVEQLQNMNSNLLYNIEANSIMTQSINNALSASFIGKGVKANTDQFKFDGSNEVKLGYSLPSNASSVLIKIFDDGGNLVKQINSSELTKGDHAVVWDGKDEHGQPVGSGKYKFTVEAKDGDKILSSNKYIFGTVSAVRFKPDGTVFVINGLEVSLSSILEIMQG